MRSALHAFRGPSQRVRRQALPGPRRLAQGSFFQYDTLAQEDRLHGCYTVTRGYRGMLGSHLTGTWKKCLDRIGDSC